MKNIQSYIKKMWIYIWLKGRLKKYETQMHTCLGGAIAEFNYVNDELEKVAQFTLYGANEEDKVWKQN